MYALQALNSFPAVEPASADSFVALSPRLYHFNRSANIQVLQDIQGVWDLREVLDAPSADALVSQTQIADVGQAAGAWLRRFHQWAVEPAQQAFAQEVVRNDGMRRLKRRVTCDSFIAVLENFPDIYESHATTLGLFEDMARQEFQRLPGLTDEDDGWGVIHADFWSGKYVYIPNFRCDLLIYSSFLIITRSCLLVPLLTIYSAFFFLLAFLRQPAWQTTTNASPL